MATAPAPVRLAEYLHTEYEPACEYIDGILALGTRPDETERCSGFWRINGLDHRPILKEAWIPTQNGQVASVENGILRR